MKKELYVVDGEDGYDACVIVNSPFNDGYDGCPWGIRCSPEEILVLHALAVDPDGQGKGTGTAVVKDILELDKGLGKKTVRLDILCGNTAAECLYRKMGFHPVQRKTMFYEIPVGQSMRCSSGFCDKIVVTGINFRINVRKRQKQLPHFHCVILYDKEDVVRKRIALLTCVLMMVAFMTGCKNSNMESYRPITDLNNLEGRKIGVNLGWASDYLLSNRDDLILYRYDETADMLMALCYKQLDAVATESTCAVQILTCSSGLRLVDGVLAMDDFVGIGGRNSQSLVDDFNAWIAEYRNTDEYQAWMQRIEEFDGINYEWPGGEWPQEGKKIVIGSYDLDFPFCFRGNDGTVNGYEIELFREFCEDCGYCPDLQLLPEEAIYAGLDNGTIDMMFGDCSIQYAVEAVSAGYLVTDSYRTSPIYVIEIGDPDHLEISGVAENDNVN